MLLLKSPPASWLVPMFCTAQEKALATYVNVPLFPAESVADRECVGQRRRQKRREGSRGNGIRVIRVAADPERPADVQYLLVAEPHGDAASPIERQRVDDSRRKSGIRSILQSNANVFEGLQQLNQITSAEIERWGHSLQRAPNATVCGQLIAINELYVLISPPTPPVDSPAPYRAN